jgi:quinol monooxygenase YgiN
MSSRVRRGIAAIVMIAKDAAEVVQIDVRTAEPGTADALLAKLGEEAAAASKRPGFVSANLHRSKDRTRVATYAQWRDDAGIEGTLYRVAHVERAGDGPFIVEGTSPLTLIVVFTCEPHEQDELVHYLIGIAQEHSVNDGFISCTIHRSLDGTRLAEYIQWRDQAALSAMAAKPSSQAHFARVKPRTSSAMYDVVKTF